MEVVQGCNEVQKSVLATMSCEWSDDQDDDEEELKMVPAVNQNANNHNVGSDSKNGEEDEEHLYEDLNEEVKATLKITINTKVW